MSNLDKIVKKFHHCNYRVIKTTYNKNIVYKIYEVWYDKNNNPTFWDQGKEGYTWGYSLAHLNRELKHILEALKYPVLKEIKLKNNKEKLIEDEE